MKYKVVLRKSDEGYSVSVPGLAGCWSQGATEIEAMENIRDAIADYLAVVNKRVSDLDWREIEVNSQFESVASITESGLASPPAKA